MKADIFMDTSGFYALLAKGDNKHEAARDILNKAAVKGQQFVTTDYILDETATLLKARDLGHLVAQLFDVIFRSKGCRIEWINQERFLRSRDLLLKHSDKPWSFTDATSFCIMKEQGIHDALTKDDHFRQAGFNALLI